MDTGSRQEQAQITHSRAALELARARYIDGLVDFLTVLDAERTLLQAEQQYATSTTNVSLDLVQVAVQGAVENRGRCHSSQCRAGQCLAGRAMMGCTGST